MLPLIDLNLNVVSFCGNVGKRYRLIHEPLCLKLLLFFELLSLHEPLNEP